MKVLHIVSSWPTSEKPYLKPFIVSQIKSLGRNGVAVDILDLRATENTFNYIIGVVRLWKRLLNRRYDIVHAHYSYCGWVGVLQRKVPVVVSFMGNDLFGVLNSRGGQRIVGYFNILFSTLLVNFAEAVIVKSSRMKELINADHVYVVPNGVDFELFRPMQDKAVSQLYAGKRNKTILFLGDPDDPRKNFRLAVSAVQILKQKYPDVELVVPFGIHAQQVNAYMNMADVLLCTSLQEGSPNVIKEAMACNLPIVSTDVGDVREVLGNTEGCYIASFDKEDLAKKLQLSLEYGKRTNGRENIKYLEINNVADKIINIYRQVCGSKRHRGEDKWKM